MNTAKWYVAESGETVGPFSAAEVLERIAAGGGQDAFVWTDGMAEWAKAKTVPELSKAPASPEVAAPSEKAGLGARLRHELIEFSIIAAYLYIAFGALIAFKFTILKGEGVIWAPWGIAVVKALILGKFILLLQAMKLGEGGSVALWRIVKKSLLFVLALFVLDVFEEFLVGRLQGKTNQEILGDMAGLLSGPFVICVLMFLILLPYFTFRELGDGLGHERLRRIFMAHGEAVDGNGEGRHD